MKDPKKLDEIITDIEERFSGYEYGSDFAEILMKCIDPNPKKRYKNAMEVEKDIDDVRLKYERRSSRKKIRKIKYIASVLGGALFTAIGFYTIPPLIDHLSIWCCVGGDENPVGRTRDMLRVMSRNEGNLLDRVLTPIQLRWLHQGIEICNPTKDVLKISDGADRMIIFPEDYWQTRIEFRAVEMHKKDKPYYCDGEGDDYKLLYDYDHIIGVPLFLKKGKYTFRTKAAVHRWFFDNKEMDSGKAGSSFDDPELLDFKIAGQEFEGKVEALDKSYGENGKYYNKKAEPDENTVIEYQVIIPKTGCHLLTIQNRIKDNRREGSEYGNKDMLIGNTKVIREK